MTPKFNLESPKSTYPLLSTKVMRKVGESRQFLIESVDSFKDKEGTEKGAFILSGDDESFKYVPNKTAQSEIKRLAKLNSDNASFDDVIGALITITVVETQYMNRPTLGLMVTKITIPK